MTAPAHETYVDDLAEPECYYPVIVMEHKEHVVWVQADSLSDALEQLQCDPEWYESISDQETLTGFWTDMSTPDTWDWQSKVYDRGEFYPGLQADAHVQIHKAVQYAAARAAQKAACAAAGHPDVRFYSTGDPHCPCCSYVKAEQLVADIRAAAQAGQVAA
jgi:hypothetical protein